MAEEDRPAAGQRPDERPTERLEPRRLVRTRENRLIFGVAAGLAGHFGFDPIIARVAFVVLTLFGGLGAFLYLGALLFVPSEGVEGQPPGATVAGQGRLAAAAGVLVLTAGVAALLTGGFVPPPLILIVAAIALYAMLRRHGGDRPTAGRVAARAGIGVGVLVLSIAGFLLSGVASATGYGALVAVVVVLIGAALVAGAVAGRREARWLVLPAAVVAVPLGVVAASDLDLRGGFGERTFRPTSAAAVPPGYRLGAGRMEIDLRGAGLPPGERRLAVSLGAGEAVVVVPRDVCVQTDARVGAGRVQAFDRSDDGGDVEMRAPAPSPPAAKRLLLSSDIGVGALHVVNDPADVRWRRGRGGGPGGERWDRDDGDESDDGGDGARGFGGAGEDGPDGDGDGDEDVGRDEAADPPQTACGPAMAGAGAPR